MRWNVSQEVCVGDEDDRSTYDVVNHIWRPDAGGMVGRANLSSLSSTHRPRAASNITAVGRLRLSHGRPSGRKARGGDETPHDRVSHRRTGHTERRHWSLRGIQNPSGWIAVRSLRFCERLQSSRADAPAAGTIAVLLVVSVSNAQHRNVHTYPGGSVRCVCMMHVVVKQMGVDSEASKGGRQDKR